MGVTAEGRPRIRLALLQIPRYVRIQTFFSFWDTRVSDDLIFRNPDQGWKRGGLAYLHVIIISACMLRSQGRPPQFFWVAYMVIWIGGDPGDPRAQPASRPPRTSGA